MQSAAQLPEEVQEQYEALLRLTIKHGITFSGMMMRAGENPLIAVVGNVKERGVQLADLFRMMASVIEEAATEGRIEERRISNPN